MSIAQFLDEYAWGKDARLYDSKEYCIGWYFWNDAKEIHECFTMQDFRSWGWTPDEMRAIVLDMPKFKM